MDNKTKKELIHYLSEFMTKERILLFNEVIEKRTQFLSIVLEDIYQPQNASAVLRTADCLGIQDVHIIEHRNSYKVNPDVALGANKWLNLSSYNNAKECINQLKKNGYKIASTALHENSISLNDFKPKTKTALVFGTESTGISDEVKDMTDVFIKIPMHGFTESYNISVAAAISMFQLVNKLNKLPDWPMKDEEKTNTVLKWVRKSVKNATLLEEKFLTSLTN